MYTRERIYKKRVCVVLTIEVRLDEVEDSVVAECTPFDVDDYLKKIVHLRYDSRENFMYVSYIYYLYSEIRDNY